MTWFIVFMLIVYAVKGDRNNVFSGKQFNTLKKWILGIILVSAFSSFIPGLLIASLALSPILMPIIVVAWIVSHNKKKQEEEKQQRGGGSRNQRNDTSGSYYGYSNAPTRPASGILPREASKRRKIIEKFNKKYELYLTESQIQRIVDASYYSPEWEREIADMNKEYNSVYEWFQGSTGWLRAYLKVFKVQSISSDFGQQRQICFSEFDQVFREVNFASFYSQDEAVRDMNDKFFTDFNDISFMIAYRFLEANGRKYDLTSRNVVKNESETDILARKYDRMPSH
ncbi:MAG: hypothetical protein NC086_01165 [Alistipes sp.]|nr:hypothetical protein [Alistipes sp.]